MKKLIFPAFVLSIIVGSCASDSGSEALLMDREAFQIAHEGKQIDLFTLKNRQGMVVQITNYGGRIVSILVPGKNGKIADVCLGYASAEGYINGSASMGATMGRFANRIAHAQFELDGVTYHLAKNAGEHTIHGGATGFRFKVWDARQIDEQSLELSYFSPDGEEGFPGNFSLKVLFSVTEDNELKLVYHATTDKPTVFNLTNHAFFNLAGEGHGDVLDHQLMVNADSFTPTNETSIPTGEIRSLGGTSLDFRNLTRIGERIDADFDQLKYAGGYDHNYVINKEEGELAMAALLYEPVSGRVMEVKTTEPGIQVYTANSLTGKGPDIGKFGHAYGSRSSICLETQHFPDSPNHPGFPSTVLNPGEAYASTTIYRFSVK